MEDRYDNIPKNKPAASNPGKDTDTSTGHEGEVSDLGAVGRAKGRPAKKPKTDAEISEGEGNHAQSPAEEEDLEAMSPVVRAAEINRRKKMRKSGDAVAALPNR